MSQTGEGHEADLETDNGFGGCWPDARHSWGGEFGQIIRQRVPITWTLCALGGRRPWFRCNAHYRGRYSGRRVALLYSGGGPFACRHCRRLKYASQNETPTLRAISRVRKIRMRLGAGFSFAEPFPEKPPRMHWRTYLRMRAARRVRSPLIRCGSSTVIAAGQLHDRSPSRLWRPPTGSSLRPAPTQPSPKKTHRRRQHIDWGRCGVCLLPDHDFGPEALPHVVPDRILPMLPVEEFWPDFC
jgi:hypothetical protein